ncbi:MAG: DUF1772 domain-containing protein [Acidobacteriota bacterium]
MSIFSIALMTATCLCALVAGFLFAFAVVAMPGLGTLDDRAFLRAFQVIDRVIQNSQPLFVLVWLGSAVSLAAAAALGFGHTTGLDRLLLLGALVIYLGGVQAPTLMVNVPLNNQLQTLTLSALEPSALAQARAAFEPRWNRWNRLRTVLATLVTVMLVVLLQRL